MGKKFNEVCSLKNLTIAYKIGLKKRSRHGLDDISWSDIERNSDEFIQKLREELISGEFFPSLFATETKTYKCGLKNKVITYNVLNIKERVIEYAIKEVLYPLYEKIFLPFSCAYRVGKYEKYLKQLVNTALIEGFFYFVSVDIKSFFGSIDQKILISEISDFIKDEKLVILISRCIFLNNKKIGIMPGHVLSPLLSNIFLHPVDTELKEIKVIRYADNFFFPQKDSYGWFEKVELISNLLQKRNLQLNKEKTKILINPNPERILLDD